MGIAGAASAGLILRMTWLVSEKIQEVIQVESTDVGKTMGVGRKLKVCKPYIAPKLQRLSLEAAKDLLLRDADTNDSELRQMIESIDQLDGAKGS